MTSLLLRIFGPALYVFSITGEVIRSVLPDPLKEWFDTIAEMWPVLLFVVLWAALVLWVAAITLPVGA